MVATRAQMDYSSLSSPHDAGLKIVRVLAAGSLTKAYRGSPASANVVQSQQRFYRAGSGYKSDKSLFLYSQGV